MAAVLPPYGGVKGSSVPSANVLHVAWRCLLHWSVGPVFCLAGQVGRGVRCVRTCDRNAKNRIR